MAKTIIVDTDTFGEGFNKQNAMNTELYDFKDTDPPFVQMDPQDTPPAHSEGLFYYDNVSKTFNVYNDEADVTLNIGEELYVRVKNISGNDIANGSVCYLSGVDSGLPTVELAKADAAGTSLATIGLATHLITDTETGYITSVGLVRDVDTDGFTSGDRLYLSAVTAGGSVNTPPANPNYTIAVGQAVVINDLTGTIQANVSIGGNTSEVVKIFNGAVLEDTQTTITTTVSSITLQYQKNGGGNLSLFFNGGFTFFEATPAASVVLTEGTDEVPQINYIFIPQSTGTLTANTTGFPTEQHVPVATVFAQTAASANVDGVFKVHAWTDHLAASNEQGHMSDINKWIRNQHATWLTGAVPSSAVVVNGGVIDNVYFSNTAGTALQLHEHTFPALDMATGTPIFVVNDSTTKYDRLTDLSTIDTDSGGNSLRSNNTYYSLVIFCVASESDADSKIFVNTPDGFYANTVDAVADALKHSNYAIPQDFKGVGFLAVRLTLRYQTLDSGTLTVVDSQDLRGLIPPIVAGA